MEKKANGGGSNWWRMQGLLIGAALTIGAALALDLSWLRPAGPSTLRRLSWWRPAVIHSGVPYNWTFYRSFYEDLRNLTLEQAEAHYHSVGVDEGRIAAPFSLRVVYSARSGLCNQLYHHLHALIMARALGVGLEVLPPLEGAGLVMPKAYHRRSYADRQAAAGRAGEVVWRPEPAGTLFDLERMAEYWGARGVALLPVRCAQPGKTPNMLPVDPAMDALRLPKTQKQRQKQQQQQEQQQQQQQEGQQQGQQAEPPRLRYDLLAYRQGQRCIAVNVAEVLKRPFMSRGLFPLQTYLEAAKKAITEGAKPTLLGDPTNQIPCVYLEHGGTMAALNISGLREQAREAAEGIFFNRTLVALSEKILSAINPGSERFDGLHLRLERDGEAWHEMVGGFEGMLEAYLKGMEQAKFDSSSVVYVASGMLSYNASEEWSQVQANITERGLAKKITYKEKLLPPSMLAGLHTEQLALVDFMVLLRANRLVGFAASSFSFLLAELRAVQGRPKSTGVLINPMGLPLDLFEVGGSLSD